MSVTYITGVELEAIYNLPPLEETIKKIYNIDIETKKPLNIQELSKRIGKYPSLLLCAMVSKNPDCSKFGILCLIEVLTGIAGTSPIYVAKLDYSSSQNKQPFNFTLSTQGFINKISNTINGMLDEHSQAIFSFEFIPENRIPKADLRNGQSKLTSIFTLDLTIELYMTIFTNEISQNNTGSKKRVNESFLISRVIVEFDGLQHLNDEQVRKDKLRDSIIQGEGCTVFRIQTPYKQSGIGSNKIYKENLSTLLNEQVEDIKNHFKYHVYDTIKTNYLLRSLIPSHYYQKLLRY